MHNPEHAATELAEKLASRDRHIIFLVGAGASCASGLPDLDGLKSAVRDVLKNEEQSAFDRLAESRNIEEILSRLRLISEVLESSSDTFEGFTAEKADTLDQAICTGIARVISESQINLEAHKHFATWLGLSRYSRPIEVFTTNYDLLLERGLEMATVPYFDGFIGVYEGRFRADLVDSTDIMDTVTPPPRWIRLWKLHGSISWTRDRHDHGAVISRIAELKEINSQRTLAIYPSLRKYQESRRIPFVVLGDRFRRALALPETLCVVTGYSFGDQDINELLFNAARLHRASEILALCHSDIPEEVSKEAKNIPNLTVLSPCSAVIGGVESTWESPEVKSPFWLDDVFTLGDFRSLAGFLLLNAKQLAEASLLEESST